PAARAPDPLRARKPGRAPPLSPGSGRRREREGPPCHRCGCGRRAASRRRCGPPRPEPRPGCGRLRNRKSGCPGSRTQPPSWLRWKLA
ncbi:hypothetical protein J1605_022793, partial [Eschrichtius robustus]